MPEFPGEHFTVVAARGGDDVWAEIRRRRIPDDDRVPEDLFGAPPPTAAASSSAAIDDSIPDYELAAALRTPSVPQEAVARHSA